MFLIWLKLHGDTRESHNLSVERQLGHSLHYQNRLFIIVLHNIVSVTFVPGLWETDKRGCSIALFKPVQLDSSPSSVVPDSYPSPCNSQTRDCSKELQTKLKEVRDFHMEKAINSSMPKGQSEDGREGCEDVWRNKRERKVWGRTRAKHTQYYCFRFRAYEKYEKLATFDVVLPNVQNQKDPWVLIPKNTLERKEKVVKHKQIDKRQEVGNS